MIVLGTIKHHASADAEEVAGWLGLPVPLVQAVCAELEAAGLLGGRTWPLTSCRPSTFQHPAGPHCSSIPTALPSFTKRTLVGYPRQTQEGSWQEPTLWIVQGAVLAGTERHSHARASVRGVAHGGIAEAHGDLEVAR